MTPSPEHLSEADDDMVCDGYPEHDWELFDERDGIKTYLCKRCGAETVEDDE